MKKIDKSKMSPAMLLAAETTELIGEMNDKFGCHANDMFPEHVELFKISMLTSTSLVRAFVQIETERVKLEEELKWKNRELDVAREEVKRLRKQLGVY